MTTGLTKTVRVHYRLAKLEGGVPGNPTLQDRLRKVVEGKLGQDARERIFPISDDGQHRGCLNYSEIAPSSFLADIMHLDGRVALPMWLHPTEPKPVAEVIPRSLAAGEASLGEPLYLMVRGNHVAAIERMGFRTSSLQRYLNMLLKAAGELETGTDWRLVPKIEVTGAAKLGGSVKKLVFKPRGLAVGDAASEAPKEKTITRRMGDFIAQGSRVIAMAVAAGADEAKLEALRASMSSDLALRARLEISVASLRRKSEAEIHPDQVQQAFAELTNEGDVHILSEDGRTDGKLVQLVHTAEVLETGGIIDWQRATYALVSAMNAWAAKGSIDLTG